jgi:hypothetical protein
VSLIVSPSICYVFYLGEIEGVEKLSPVTLLVDHIYRYCQQAGIRLLDIGIATEHGEPNVGLIGYKRNLGCATSLKFTLSTEVGS